MFWDIPLQDSCNGISRDIPLWYIQVLLGISRDKQGYLCADLRDIQGYPRFSYFGESYPRLSSRMKAQNCLFRALECSNWRTAIWISSWKLYFHLRRRPGLEAAGRCTAPSPGAGSQAPASAPSPARGVGGSSAGREPFSPAAGAGAAGAGGASAALLNSSPLLTRLLQGWSERSPDAPSKPTMSP